MNIKQLTVQHSGRGQFAVLTEIKYLIDFRWQLTVFIINITIILTIISSSSIQFQLAQVGKYRCKFI